MNYEIVLRPVVGCADRSTGSLSELVIHLRGWFQALNDAGYVIVYEVAKCEWSILHPNVGLLSRVTLEVSIKKG